MGFYLKRLRNNPKGPHGPIPPSCARAARAPPCARAARAPPAERRASAVHPARFLRPVEASKGRLESKVAERILSERINWVGGMRVSVVNLE